MQSPQNTPSRPKRAPIVWGAELFSMTLAVVSTVLLFSPAYGATIPWPLDYIITHYGAPFVGLASVIIEG